MSRSNAIKKVSVWLQERLARLPPRWNLVYVEWNSGWKSVADYRAKKPLQMLFTMFGFAWSEAERFNPEVPDHLERLADPEWEGASLAEPISDLDDTDIYELFEGVLPSSAELRRILSERDLAYGEHEGQVKLCNRARAVKKTSATKPYYELHVKGGGNSIDKYETGDFDEDTLLDHDKIASWPKAGIKLHLRNGGKLHDFVHFYRGWLICNLRTAELFKAATKKVQIFPVPLVSKGNPVAGYFVVNLYEKLNCLSGDDILPPAYEGGPQTFNPEKGYRIKMSAVGEKQVFRINYEHFRLLVSQEFRDQLDEAKITGVQWLRRASVP
jgi:hypothetical protein